MHKQVVDAAKALEELCRRPIQISSGMQDGEWRTNSNGCRVAGLERREGAGLDSSMANDASARACLLTRNAAALREDRCSMLKF
jgi:hypothetical protein